VRELLVNLISLYTLVLFVRVVLSWFPSNGGALSVVRDWTGRVTEPLLGPIRRALPSMGGLDLSPVVLILVLQVVRILILR
jgi:YggT family protein